MLYARAFGALAVVLFLGWIGWTVNGWRVGAARAVTLATELAETKGKVIAIEAARKNADDARTLLAAQLLDTQEATRVSVDVLRKKIPAVVSSNAICSYGLDVNRLLNDARGYAAVSAAARRTAETPPASAAP